MALAEGIVSELAVKERTDRLTATAGNAWPSVSIVALIAGAVALSGLFLREFRAAVEIWDASTAYGHCYLILPMTLYLLWDRRDLIRRSTPLVELHWVLLGIPVAVVWLAAERLGIMEGRQLAAIAGFEILFLVVLGRRLFWDLSGPLVYLFFLVPFGAFVTPALQHFTADFTVMGLKLLGIPYYVDTFVIETPAGTFLVAEACAGLRFLIAAIAFGVFYALMSFRTVTRRSIYILLSIIVPVVANGFRAFGIVFLGQVLGSAEAAAADHVIYGWVFFSIVMLLLVAVGQPFREQPALEDTGLPISTAGRAQGWLPMWGAAAAVFVLAIGPAVARVIDRLAVVRPLVAELPWTNPPGCARSPAVGSGQAIGTTFIVSCGASNYRVDIATYPARSTSRAMLADRRRHTQEIGAEDSSSSSLDRIDGDKGNWTLVQTTEPDGVTAFAPWIGGQPAFGGLSERGRQARDSLLGSPFQPVLVMITALEPGRVASPKRGVAVDQIRAMIQAQGDLNEQVGRVSRVGSGD